MIARPATVAGFAAGARHPGDVDALARDLVAVFRDRGLGPDVVLSHRVGTDAGPELAFSFGWTALLDPDLVCAAIPDGVGLVVGTRRVGGPVRAAAAQSAATAGLARAEGRAIVFAGHDQLPPRLSAGALCARTAIDSVRILAAGTAPEHTVVERLDFVRPVLCDGRLELLVQPAAGGVVIPFEIANPTPCCADH